MCSALCHTCIMPAKFALTRLSCLMHTPSSILSARPAKQAANRVLSSPLWEDQVNISLNKTLTCLSLLACCRYYVAHASKPKDRAALALAVGVGSLVEEEPERGVAHILEHLAFNATEVDSLSLWKSSVCDTCGYRNHHISRAASRSTNCLSQSCMDEDASIPYSPAGLVGK